MLDKQVEQAVALLQRREPSREVPPYSTSLVTARTLLALLGANGDWVELVPKDGGWLCTLISTRTGTHSVTGDTEQLAICGAFLERERPRAKFE